MRRVNFVTSAEDLQALSAVLEHCGADAIRTWTSNDTGYADCCVDDDTIGKVIGDVDAVADDIIIAFGELDELVLQTGEHPSQSLKALSHRSPAEVYLAALHSFGSWTGFLGYAAASGAVAWIGLFLGSVPLQIVALLIAPFGGPAMNAAVATAKGDSAHLGASLRRYLVAIAVAIAVAAVLHLLFADGAVTTPMMTTANISVIAVLLPLVAGAGSGLNIVQSERSSLVTSAATGVLVAAGFSSAAALVGMATITGDWPLVRTGLFLLVLNMTATNLAGTVVLALYGLSARNAGLADSSTTVRWIGFTITACATVALVGWQLDSSPDLQRSSIEQNAETLAVRTVDQLDDIHVLALDATFTRPAIDDQTTMFVSTILQASPGTNADLAEQRAATAITQAIETRWDVTVFVEATVYVDQTETTQQ